MNVSWKGWKTTPQKSQVAAAGIVRPAGRASSDVLRILKPVIQEMWGLFDRYISDVKGDLPWWHTERSLVGFLHAAASRVGLVAMQEYRAFNKRSKRWSHFPDWWFQTAEKGYVLQAKKGVYGHKSKWETIKKNLLSAASKDFETPDCGGYGKIAAGFAVLRYVRDKDSGVAWSDRFGQNSHQPDPRMCDFIAYYLAKDATNMSEGDDGAKWPGLLMVFKVL